MSLSKRLKELSVPICGLLILLVAGCQSMGLSDLKMPSLNPLKLRSQSPDEEDIDDEFRTTFQTPLIGDYTTIAGLNMVSIEGVGLVTGLDGTGGDPPPSMYRTALLDAMKKRGVKSPNRILRSPTTALVVVKAYLPPLIRKKDRFDVEVRLPGNSDATSLRGGTLLAAYLSERAIVPGRGVLKGHVFARASGPILTSTGEGNEQSLAGVLRNGRILGGGISMKDRHMTIYLRNDFRSVRNSKRIADRIGLRFHSFDRYGIKEPLAEAKTDQTILLKIPEIYRNNYPRYLQVIRNVSFRESHVAQRVRMKQLERKLRDPATAERAALQLEAFGHDAEMALKTGLKNRNPEVRFHSAVALAYLEVPDGQKVLATAARDERAFRVFALAALSVIDDAETHMFLRDLMSSQTGPSGQAYDSSELRYGAFRALWTLDKNDPFIRGRLMKSKFRLHVLETSGDPMIHLTHHRKSEVVLFGADQEFRTPMLLRAGNHILVTASPGNKSVTVSRFEVGQDDEALEVSARVADVIRAAVELGANYPDIAQMLTQADKQHNLPGRIAIDSLPQAGRTYYRSENSSSEEASSGKTRNSTKVGRPNLIPNMFPNLKNVGRFKKKETLTETDDSDSKDETGNASLSNDGSSETKPASSKMRERFDIFHILKKSEFVEVQSLDDESE